MQDLFRFKITSRLNKPADYQAVFKSSWRTHAAFFTILVRLNQQPQARLGMALAKKAIRRSVDRSRIKRIFRESFRLRQSQLPCVDIVILAKKGLDASSSSQLRKDIDRQWDELVKHYKA